jgi:hypothetical protein
MRITTGQDEPEGTVQPAETTTAAAANAQAIEQNEQMPFFATPESLDFYQSSSNRLEQRLSDESLIYTRAVIIRDGDDCNFEVQDERLENEHPRERADHEAGRICDTFDFTQLEVYIYEDAFFIVQSVEQTITARHNLFEHYLDENYNDVNEVFHLEEELTVAHLELAFYLDEERDHVESQSLHIALTSEVGFYQVEAMRILIRTVLIRVPRDMTFGAYVSYQAVTQLTDESGVNTPETQGIDFAAELYTDVWGSNLESFDREAPEFNWHMSRTDDFISVNLLISHLDQENSVERRISAQLGESESEPFDQPEILLAPKGLDSFNLLAILSANFTSRSGTRRYITINPRVPDFSFLPLEAASTSNRATLVYVSADNMHVTMVGETQIEDQLFRTEFVKENDATTYNITLYGEPGSAIDFPFIRRNIYDTMEIGFDSTVLTTNPEALSRLAAFNIVEDGTIIANPVIEISYDTYLTYTVSGRFSPDDSLANRINVSCQFINLDGAVFSYLRFFFNPAISSNTLFNFFNIQSGDAGFGSLRFDDFQLISSNRDFNADQVTQLRHSNVYLFEQQEVIIQNGLTLNLETTLLTDCDEYSFCRQLRAMEFPSSWTFTGLVGVDETILTSNFADLRLNDQVNFTSNELRMRLDSTDGEGVGHLHMNGRLNLFVEPERMLSFRSVWSFGRNPTSPIYLQASRNSIYDNVFELGLIDMVESRIEGEISLDNTITNFNFTTTPVLGNDCYVHENLVQQLQSTDDNVDYEVLNFDSTEVDENGHLRVLNDNCAVGSANFYLFSEEPESNTFTANFYFDDFDQFVRTFYDVRSDDQTIPLIRMITFPDGLNTQSTYSHAQHEDRPLEFYGRMDFLGVHTYGTINANIEDQLSEANLIMPSFSIGGGNLQFLDTKAIQRRYHVTEDTFCHGRLDCHLSHDDFMRNNTLTFEVDPINVAGSDLTLSANAIIFEILQRVEITLDQPRWNFRFNGKPFRGAFDTEIVVEVVPVANLARERDSIVRVVLDQIDNFHALETNVNRELKNWISNILVSHIEIRDREAEWTERRQYLVHRLGEMESCPNEEQCMDIPTLTCSEFAQEAVCVREQTICDNVIQRCVTTETHENRWGSYDVCTGYEHVCQDGATSIVCLDYELHNIPDRCITMELSCTRVSVEDLSCTENQEQLEADIAAIDRRLTLVRELLDLMSDLTESSICLIRVEDDDERASIQSCAEKEQTIEGFPEHIDILDLFTLRDSRSIMSLRNVVSSDSMIFQSDVSLYGDWTRSSASRDRLVVLNNVAPERENRDQGYDLGVESLLYINHFLDFNSVNHTTYELSESVKQIVCLENSIGPEESARIQVLMRELSIVDGNATFCPEIEVVDNSRFINADTSGSSQESIYAQYDPNEEYVSNSLRYSDDSELRFRYYGNQMEVPVSEIRETYAFEERPTDEVPQDITNRVDEQTIEEGLEVERTREEIETVREADMQELQDEMEEEEQVARTSRQRQEQIDIDQEQQEAETAQNLIAVQEGAQEMYEEAREAVELQQNQADEETQESAEAQAAEEAFEDATGDADEAEDADEDEDAAEAEDSDEDAAEEEEDSDEDAAEAEDSVDQENSEDSDETPDEANEEADEEAAEDEEISSMTLDEAREEVEEAREDAEEAREDAINAQEDANDARDQASDLAENAQREIEEAQREIAEAQEELLESQEDLTELIAESDEEDQVTEEVERLQSYLQLNLGSILG